MATNRDWEREIETERAMKDEFMARHPESPFVAEGITFHPLRYFAPDPEYRVPAHLDRREVPDEAYLRTNRDGQSVMRHIGDLRFEISRTRLTLRVYHAGEGVGTSVFIPFRDLTSGRDTYGPGRYLTLELTESDDYELDLNRAFNPYCAYTDAFECGFPPSENDLAVAVRAGEKVWAADRNPRTPNALLLDRTRPATSSTAKRTSARPRVRTPPRSRDGRQRAPKGTSRKPR
ncbi:MAG: DUF1684 domain-containing protein [Thermoplasmata archaeon]